MLDGAAIKKIQNYQITPSNFIRIRLNFIFLYAVYIEEVYLNS